MPNNNVSTESEKNQVEYDAVVERDSGLLEWEHERIIIHRVTFKRMLAIGGKYFDGMWALYCFYFCKAREDQTNQPWALDVYCMKGLGWSTDKFYRYKKLLLKHEFISQIVRRDENGRYRQGTKGKAGAYFIRVNHMNKTNYVQSPENPEIGETPREVKPETSALKKEHEVLERDNNNPVVVDRFAKKYEKAIPDALKKKYASVLEKCTGYMIDNIDPENIKSPIGYLTSLLKNPDDIPEIEQEPEHVPKSPDMRSEQDKEFERNWNIQRNAHPIYQS